MTSTDDRKFLGMTPGQAVLTMLATSPVLIVVTRLVDFGTGETAWLCTGLLALALQACWHLRRHVWFWVAAAILLALHVPVARYFPWTRSHPGYSLLPLALIDFGFDYGFLKLAERVMAGGAEARGLS